MSDGLDADEVPAPALREVAQVWWDSEHDPLVRWRDGRRTFVLVDADGDHELELARLTQPAEDPIAVALALATGLAACDFPPTGERAAPGRVRATLHAAGLRNVRLA